MSTKPQYASEVPYVPVNWDDRDNITGRLMEILEAVMPEGRQLEATKGLVKEMTKQYWISLFNTQFDCLTQVYPRGERLTSDTLQDFYDAIWGKVLEMRPVSNPDARPDNQ